MFARHGDPDMATNFPKLYFGTDRRERLGKLYRIPCRSSISAPNQSWNQPSRCFCCVQLSEMFPSSDLSVKSSGSTLRRVRGAGDFGQVTE
jgi:hypothetical protein